jgi:hypothetical protein
MKLTPCRRRWKPTGRGPAALAASALLLGLAALPERIAAQDGAGAVRVVAVRLEGVRALEPSLVRAAVVTRAGQCRSPLLLAVCAVTDAGWAVEPAFLDPLVVREDEERIRRHYASWGYPDAAVESEIVPHGGDRVGVRFRISEGAPVLVSSLEVRGWEAVPGAARLAGELPLREGEPFAAVRLEASERRIQAALAEAGHPFARVVVAEQRPAGERLVDVVLRIEPGPAAVFGPTVVLPGPPLTIDDIEERLAYRPGEPFRPSALERTAERLYRVPVVTRVFIDPLPSADADSIVVTTVGVTPGRVQGLQFGGAFSTSTCLEGTLGWGHRYLLGRPRTLTLSGSAGNLLARPLRRFPCWGVGEDEFERLAYALRADLREPIGADTWLLLGGAFSRETAPDAFVRRGVQARIGVTRMLPRATEGTVVYAPEQRDLLAAGPIFCAVHGVCGAGGIEALATDAVSAPVELTLAWTPPLLRRPPAPPPPGPAWLHPALPPVLFAGRLTAAGAAAITGSEFAFGSALFEGTAVAFRGRRAEVAAHARLGALAGADVPLPPHVRLFGGGPRGMRGVGANRLGPQILVTSPGEAAALPCVPERGGCEGARVDPTLVRARPAGGDRLAEAALEARFWAADRIQLAGFVDFGYLRTGARPAAPAAVAPSETAWAPGIAALVLSGFGPVRVDVAYDPSPMRRYPLLLRSDPTGEQVDLGTVLFDRFRFDDPPAWRETWRRLQFHLTMGLPF